jgi:hypothetical protein
MTTRTLSRADFGPALAPRRLLAYGQLGHATQLFLFVIFSTSVFLGLYGIVPAYVASQTGAITAAAANQGVPSSWLAAVFYNEILGTEDAVLQEILPGDSGPMPAVRQALLGLHFCTLKQMQWQAKGAMALLGGDPTVGPAGIRVSVGREIRREVRLAGGYYTGSGWLERPSIILDLSNPATALEYLAGNLRRGQDRLVWSQRGDWAASARWHNTGVVYDSAIVRPADWDKGSKYVARVEQYLPEAGPPATSELEADLEVAARPPRGWGRDGQAFGWPPTSVVQ